MQTVSQEWKDNHESLLVSEGYVEVTLALTDPDADEDATSVDNGAIYISDTEQVTSEVDKDIRPYTTLEPNIWVLDGSREIVPEFEGDNVLPDNVTLSNCTRGGDIFTRSEKVYDSILRLDSWKPEAGKVYTIIIDILDNVLTAANTLTFKADSRFAFENIEHRLQYGRNYIYVKTRDTITNDMLGSVWLNSPITAPSIRFKMSIVEDGNLGDCGFIGNELSDINGNFQKLPTITVNFSEVHSKVIQGVTITWGEAHDEYARDFTVTAYNGDTVVATSTITDNSDGKTIVYMDIVNYDRIVIAISKWCLPYRRARVAEILIGVEKVYSKSDLFSFSHSQEVDPISASLPKSEISFSIDNSDGTYNPNNTEGLSKYLMERQEIKSRYGYKLNNKVEWIDSGTFYISEWDAPQNGLTADFTARDLLEFMTGTYYKGVYNASGRSLYDLAIDVLQDANLPLDNDGVVKWVIDDSLKNVYTVAPLPVDTHANCLQLIANAGGCVLYQDRKGILRMRKISTKSNLFDANNLSHLYWDGIGYACNNDTVYSAIIPVEKGVKYDVKLQYNTSIMRYAFSKGYPVTNSKPYNKDGVEMLPYADYNKNGFSFIVTDASVTHLMVTFYRDGYEVPENTLSKITNSIHIGVSTDDYKISHFNSYSKSDLSLTKPLKQVEVPWYSYSVATGTSELYKGTMSISGTTEVVISYSGTATNVTATISGGKINSAVYYANSCVLSVTATGNVTITITGYRLESSTVKTMIPSGTTGETITVDNPLISSSAMALDIGRWVEGYMKNRMILSSEWRADPRLDALDVVENVNDYNTNNVIMTTVNYEYKGAFRGSGEGRVI